MSQFMTNDDRPENRNWLIRLLYLWFGASTLVNRKEYALSGFGLMLFKYGVESWLIARFERRFFSPLEFLRPAVGYGFSWHFQNAWLQPLILVGSIAFVWIAVSMSIRRAADAGVSPWWGTAVLVPISNVVTMFTLCFLPSRPRLAPVPEPLPEVKLEEFDPTVDDFEDASPVAVTPRLEPRRTAIIYGVSLCIGTAMLGFCVYLLTSYGVALFLGTPLMMGMVASYLYNREESKSSDESIRIAFKVVCGGLLILLIAGLEGAICILMAAPFCIPVAILGGLMGKFIADITIRPHREMWTAVFVLPLWALGESYWNRPPEQLVLSEIEINAPPEVVWRHVVDFPEITTPPGWIFRAGVACPKCARIEGHGVGAIRYCEFTTGSFIEPITTWDEPNRLAFEVAEQPEPMQELSPYPNIHPPHLSSSLRSKHGEFRLIPLATGGTCLEGRTWYEVDMYPNWYWNMWSDAIIHRIHLRVLEHIKTVAEEDGEAKNM
jgi:uncharacterized membrane protein YhaH (DUF805 family)